MEVHGVPEWVRRNHVGGAEHSPSTPDFHNKKAHLYKLPKPSYGIAQDPLPPLSRKIFDPDWL